MSDIEELYKELEKKTKLPSFKEIDEEFEISDIEEVGFFLRKIRRKMIEKIDSFGKILESLLHPETDFASMFECKDFNEQDMKEAIGLYKRIKIIERNASMLELECDYRSEAVFINDTYTQWKGMKGKLLSIIKKLRQCWEKEESKIKFESYVG